jgi:uncharacterized delta-60 repeat protein
MMSRVWRTVLLVAVLCVGLGATAVGASAQPSNAAAAGNGAPGELDSSFGKGGKVDVAFPAENAGSTGPTYELPFEFTPGHLEMARAPGGKIVVAGATKIVRYLANGQLDPSFGGDGSISIPRPPGAVFVLAGVAVDSYGRVVLAGLTRPLPSNSTPDPVLSSAALMRFDADGSRDVSFGIGGMLVTDFGLGAPKAPGGPYLGASVGLRDIVIDAQNRPVITGGFVTELGSERSTSVKSQGFVARLTEAGALDGSFGVRGMLTFSTLTSLGQLVPRSAGYLTLSSEPQKPVNLLTGLDANGNLDPNFGSFGFRALGASEAPAVSIAPSGKILLLGRPQSRRAYKQVRRTVEGETVTKRVSFTVHYQTVHRLLPSGTADPGFNRIGQIRYLDPKVGSFSAIAVDSQERIYIAGRQGKRVSKSPKNKLVRKTFLIKRANPNGTFDHSFGTHGTVTTGFGGPSSSFATQVMLDAKGRILVGGGIVSPELESGGGFAIARYLPGS